jgi:hypothetical protein
MIFIQKLRVQIVNKPRSPRSMTINKHLAPSYTPIVSRFHLRLKNFEAYKFSNPTWSNG